MGKRRITPPARQARQAGEVGLRPVRDCLAGGRYLPSRGVDGRRTGDRMPRPEQGCLAVPEPLLSLRSGPRSAEAVGRSRAGIVAAGLLAVAAAWLAWPRELAAQRASRPGVDQGGLWVSDSALPDGRRLLLVVDPVTRHTAVYHVDADRGTLTLRSTRDISWDLMVEDFNAQDPKPAALRNLLNGVPAPTTDR